MLGLKLIAISVCLSTILLSPSFFISCPRGVKRTANTLRILIYSHQAVAFHVFRSFKRKVALRYCTASLIKKFLIVKTHDLVDY